MKALLTLMIIGLVYGFAEDLNSTDLISSEPVHGPDCIPCEKILKLCYPKCGPSAACVVTQQTCAKCGEAFCVPISKLSLTCDALPIAICISEDPTICLNNCKITKY